METPTFAFGEFAVIISFYVVFKFVSSFSYIFEVFINKKALRPSTYAGYSQGTKQEERKKQGRTGQTLKF